MYYICKIINLKNIIMKRNVKIFSLVVLFVSTMIFTQSCDKVKEAAEFDVKQDLPTMKFDLDSASTKEVRVLYENSFDINLDSILEANGIDKGKIKNGKFEEIRVSIDNPTAEMNLGFVSSLEFKVSENANFEGAETLAEAKDIDPDATEIIFKMTDKTMDKYLEMSKFYFRLYGNKVGEIPVEKLPLLLKSKIKFTVSPLN